MKKRRRLIEAETKTDTEAESEIKRQIQGDRGRNRQTGNSLAKTHILAASAPKPLEMVFVLKK